MLIDLIISSIQKDEKFNNLEFKNQSDKLLGNKHKHYSQSKESSISHQNKRTKNNRKTKQSGDEMDKKQSSNDQPSNRESSFQNQNNGDNKVNNSFEILKNLNTLFNNNNGKEFNYNQNIINDNINHIFNKQNQSFEHPGMNPPNQSSENGGNTLIKRFLFNKMNEVLVNNTLSEKLILYTIISNSNFDNLFPPTKETRKESPKQKSDSDSLNQLNIEKNTNNTKSKNNPSLQNSTNYSHHSNIDFLVQYTNDESVRNIVERFCKYIFANGYTIVHKNNINTMNNNTGVNNNTNGNSNNNSQFIKFNPVTNNMSQAGEKDYFRGYTNSAEEMRTPNTGNLSYNYNYNQYPNNNNNNTSFSNYHDLEDESQKKRKDIINCPHVNKKHYAKVK